MIKKTYLFVALFLIIITLSGCSSTCTHCNNEFDDKDCYPSVLFEMINYEKLPRNIKINYDFILNYNSLSDYFINYTPYNVEDYFCDSLFFFNYVLALWIEQDVHCEYKFLDFSFKDNKIYLDITTFSPVACAMQPSLYFIVIPKLEVPIYMSKTTKFEVVLQ